MTAKINAYVILLLVNCVMIRSWELSRRVFDELGCKGVHDKQKFARLVRLCEECYEMYGGFQLHSACRSNCFQNEIFGLCLKDLLYSDEEEKLNGFVSYLKGEEK